jgi:ABC-type dipeptide/oligopeptide/nickel transport system permease component
VLIRTIAGRVLPSLVSLFGVLVIAFVLTRALPGDAAAYLAGPAASAEAVLEIRESLGLDASLPAQFWLYLRQIGAGELGHSWATGQPVLRELGSRLPASLELTGAGLLFALSVALPLGVLSAVRPGSWLDHAARVLTTMGVALPTFFTGLLLVYVFYYRLGWLPAPMGRLSPFAAPPPAVTGLFTLDALIAADARAFTAALSYLCLPAVTLGIFALAPIARMTRASMLAVLSSEFIRTARASRLSRYKVFLVYGLRNALMPVVTLLGMVFSYLLGANVLVEKVFSWPGLGSFALEALVISDYAAVQGFVLCMGVLYVLLNLSIDVAYGLIDPRVRLAS